MAMHGAKGVGSGDVIQFFPLTDKSQTGAYLAAIAAVNALPENERVRVTIHPPRGDFDHQGWTVLVIGARTCAALDTPVPRNTIRPVAWARGVLGALLLALVTLAGACGPLPEVETAIPCAGCIASDPAPADPFEGMPEAFRACAALCERNEPGDRGQGCIDQECNPLLSSEVSP